MFQLPSEAETWLRRTGEGAWVDNLPQHISNILGRFKLQGIRVITGGVSGLTLLAEGADGREVIIKTEPGSVKETVTAFARLSEDMFTPELLDADEQLNAIVISYIKGQRADSEQTQIEELIPVLRSWQAVKPNGLLPLKTASQTRLGHSKLLSEILREDKLRGKLDSDLEKTFDDAMDLLSVVEPLYEQFLTKASLEEHFVHTDLGPHNMIRRVADQQIIVVDIAGVTGGMSYQIGSAGLLVQLDDYMNTPQRIITLSEAVEADTEAALFWAAFRATTSAINLCGRERRHVDSAKMIAAAHECLRRADLESV